MAKRTPGLRKKGEIWHIEKVIFGELIRQSTGETELDQAERYLAQLIEQRRKVVVYGERLERTFNDAAARFIEEYEHKRSLDRDITTLKAGISAGTLNRDMAIIRRVLSLSARLWRDEQGRPWLDTVPMLPTVQGEKRKPRPINWQEQESFLKQLPR